MFVTDKIIYLQMHKTACTHIASLLSKYVGGLQLEKHSFLQDYKTKKFICGSIRNPWDWYVSLWAFGCNDKGLIHSRVVFRRILFIPTLFKHKLSPKYGPYNSGNLQARDILYHFINEIKKPISLWKDTYKDNKSSECFRKWLKMMYDPARRRNLFEGYSESSVSEFTGLMTYRYCGFFLKDFFQTKNFKGIKNIDELRKFDRENNILDFTMRVENLENDFLEMLEKFGYNIDEKTKNQIRSAGKTNVSSHLETSHYYDEETIKLVAEKEKLIIEKYNYKPPLNSQKLDAGNDSNPCDWLGKPIS